MALATRLAMGVSLTALLASPLAAQTPTADVTGAVRDSAAAPLVDVAIQARNRASGLVYGAKSSAAGRYRLRGLPPGLYDITAERIGLRSTTLQDVRLVIGRTVEFDFTMGLAAIELEPLIVRVEAPLIETTKSKVSYVIDNELIQRLPDESRQFVELAQLVPGATAGTAATGGPPPSGRRDRPWVRSTGSPRASWWMEPTSRKGCSVT